MLMGRRWKMLFFNFSTLSVCLSLCFLPFFPRLCTLLGAGVCLYSSRQYELVLFSNLEMRNLLVEEEARRRTRKGGAGDSCIVQCIPADVGFLFHFFFFSFSTLFFRFGNSLLCVCVGMLCPWGLVPGTLMEYSCPLPPHHTVLMSVCLHWLEKRLGLFVIFQAT